MNFFLDICVLVLDVLVQMEQVGELFVGFDIVVVMVELLCDVVYGDMVINVVMVLVKFVGKKLCDIVDVLVVCFVVDLCIIVVDVVGLGFLNLCIDLV